jgi:hypothetical protein
MGHAIAHGELEAALKEVQPHPFLSAMRESPAEQPAPAKEKES